MSKHPMTHCEHGIDRAYRCIDCIEAECDALRARVQELERRQAMLPSDLRVIADIGFPATAERVNGELEALRHDLRKVMDSRNAEVNALEALRASIAALAERWMEQQAAYPNSEGGKHAAAAVRLCATELRQLGEGNSAAAQEGL